MKLPLPFSAALILAGLQLSAISAEAFKVLKLKDGTEYKNAEIVGVNAKGVRIMHDSGAATADIDSLPDALKAKYEAAYLKAKEKAAVEPPPAPVAEKPKPSMAPKEKLTPAAAAAPDPNGGQAAPAPAPAKADKPAPAPLPEIYRGKVFGIAEALADKFNLDGKIIRVDILVNSASRIESVSKDEYRVFVGDPFTKLDSDYAFIRFPAAGRKKIETMLSGARGRMTLYMQVDAQNPIPLAAVGRSTRSGSPGQPIEVIW